MNPNNLINRIDRQYILIQMNVNIDPDADINSDNVLPFFTDEAIGLIKYYLSSYLDELDKTDNFEKLIQTLPKEIADDIEAELMKQNYDRTIRYKPNQIQQLKNAVMDSLVKNIMVGDDYEVFGGGEIINPWEVEHQFRSTQAIRELFHLQPLTEEEKYRQIPITVDVDTIINNNHFSHKMTEELVRGIITFYKEIGAQHPLSMFGTKFNYETKKSQPIIYSEFEHYIFLITINNHLYSFSDEEFMRGLITAASWLNVDPHSYLTDLTEYEWNYDMYIRLPHTFIKLTF